MDSEKWQRSFSSSRGIKLFCTPATRREHKMPWLAVPGAETVVVGDLASIAQTREVAEQVNQLGPSMP